MRAIDVRHMGRDKVICCWDVDGVLVDPGPQSTEGTLLEALAERVPSALLLTHIHFDHAGASGALVRRWPDLPVYVHERGAPHMAAPERLVASAARLYGGEEGLARLWGEVVPVPEANMHVLRGGETVLDDFRVEYTPGHAWHHVSFLHEPTGTAFVGDVAGVRIPPAEYVTAATRSSPASSSGSSATWATSRRSTRRRRRRTTSTSARAAISTSARPHSGATLAPMSQTAELPRVAGPDSELGGHWRVIVRNDDHNTFDHVAQTLARHIPGVSVDKGYAI